MCQFFSDATGVCSAHNWLLAKKSMNVNVRFTASCVAIANLHRSGKNLPTRFDAIIISSMSTIGNK